jgi:hypothetical protein
MNFSIHHYTIDRHSTAKKSTVLLVCSHPLQPRAAPLASRREANYDKDMMASKRARGSIRCRRDTGEQCHLTASNGCVQEEELLECTFKPKTGRMPAFIKLISNSTAPLPTQHRAVTPHF